MVMLLLVAAMAILMEYSLSKVILGYQNKSTNLPAHHTPKQNRQQAQPTQEEAGGCNFCTEATGAQFLRRLVGTAVGQCVFSGRLSSCPSVVMGYAGSCCTVAPLPELWRRQGDCADRRASCPQHGAAPCMRAFFAALSGCLFYLVSCLSLQSLQVSAKILRMFLNPSVKIDLQNQLVMFYIPSWSG